MNIFQAQKLGLKKIKFSKGKSLFLVIPICLMVGLIVLASSEAQNLIKVAHSSIFSPIEGQNEILELTKVNNMGPRDTEETGFSDTDVDTITDIENVEKSSLVTELPIEEIRSNDTFDGKTISVGSLYGLDEEYAKIYTNESFDYSEDSPIPIILNANDFYEIHENWQGQTSIEISMTRGADETELENAISQSPINVRALSYDRDELIGKVITIQFGGFSELSDYTQDRTSSGFVYTVKTQEELNSEIEARKDAISLYWDYDKISMPLTYEFIIVGISEGEDKTKTFVPLEFAQKLIQDYLSYEITARNGSEIPESEMNSTYIGLVYDGVTLESDTTGIMFAGMRKEMGSQVEEQFSEINEQIEEQNRQISEANEQNKQIVEEFSNERRAGGPPPQMPGMISIGSVESLNAGNINVSFPTSTDTFNIPGLVYAKDSSTNELTGEYTSFDFTQELPLISNSILVKINDVSNREQVVSDLNTNGFSFQDYSKYKQFEKLEKYLKIAIDVASIIFMVITALFILINMAKFVSEGRKEIGIFRAIGASKGDIRLLFILQSLSYALISILLGALLGISAVWAISNLIVNSAQNLINSTIGETIVLSSNISQADFLNLNYQMILIYAGTLLLVTLIVSLIPSGQATKVSPVEAIRN
ncbi:ABC transporter permease [Candidatus Dojkabacteria bacterium]|nr:ABC transporter permease [Candidatus Dojkabacteria bacterium]